MENVRKDWRRSEDWNRSSESRKFNKLGNLGKGERCEMGGIFKKWRKNEEK